MGRKKPIAIDDDEYSFPDENPEEKLTQIDEKINKTANNKPKKTKKGGKKTTKDEDDGEEEEPINLDFGGKKKPNKSKKSTAFSAFSALNALAEVDDDDDDDNDGGSEIIDKDGEDDEVAIDFGKKKKSKKKASGKFSLDLYEKEDEVEISNNNNNDDDENVDEEIEFDFGKKKKSKKKKDMKFALEEDEDSIDNHKSEINNNENNNNQNHVEDEGDNDVEFDFGKKKKKSSKKKKGGITSQEEDDLDKLPAEFGESKEVEEKASVLEEPKESELDSKNQKKKKKKKSGRTAQEEDDLDKLLAELDGPTAPSSLGPAPSSSVPPPTEAVEVEKELEVAETVESAAAKKKKKKKEKEKEKKAAAKKEEVEVKEEAPTKGGKAVDNKKLPKHVREMQEALARRKEEEERRKREEEERLQKEEEERKRLEELERLAEEAKKRKKEREKEKLLKKKQEGKLLTGKQKEEQRRLEAMRRQFLSQNESSIGADAPVVVKKKPKYESKRSKHKNAADSEKSKESQHEVNETEVADQVEEDAGNEVSEIGDKAEEEIKQEQEEEAEVIEEEEDDEEWDAKSWDDVDVTLPATSPFAEEDREEEDDAPAHHNNIKKGVSNLGEPSKKIAAPNVPVKNVEENEVVKKKKDFASKKEVKASDAKSEKNNAQELRSPICCILGHVDTGKTKLLDCIRRTNVQEGEAGGITQQIGATYFPTENIRERTKELKEDAKLKVPGLLIIDTPGHESFSNLRSRGSSLCDIAVLVVDIMHGLEPQTIESLKLLTSRKTEFIVALNKVDRLYGWKKCPNAPIRKALDMQKEDVRAEFKMRLAQIITEFMEQGLNTALYYQNKEMGETFNIVPTSAISGEGIPDLLLLLINRAQRTMEDKLTYQDEVECTVLEVKVMEGLGTTIDVVLVNGTLHEGDQIVVCGMSAPIVTTVRALMTPHPMKELRVKGTYLHHKEIKAAQGIKIAAHDLEHAVAGTALYVVGPDDDVEDVKETVMQDMNRVMGRIDKSGEGVYVQASTLGSLEALTEFLKSPRVNIPFCDFSIGPVHKKDVMKASVMLERGKKEYATILAFDVKIMPDARDLANETGVRIFEADIIYHLFDQFEAYIGTLRAEKKKESAEEAVFPCVLKIMPNCVFNKKDPIVLGVDVCEGILKIGTPICVPSREFIDIGKITSIEINHKQVDMATKGQKVAIKIVGSNSEEQQKMFGRHFEMTDELVSHITRRSIDVLKADYRDDLSMEEWKLVVKLKQIFKIL